MSFASETKAELCRIEPERECCRLAQCYGMFLFGNSFSFSAVSFLTESAPVARRAAQMAAGAAEPPSPFPFPGRIPASGCCAFFTTARAR